MQSQRQPVKCSVAAVVRDPTDAERFLIVKRPPDDDRLPNVWGLPAVTLQSGELPEEGLRRVGREKLNAEIEPTRFLGIKAADRGEYELILMDIEARLVGGEPSVHAATTRSTRYVDQRWTRDPLEVRDAAVQGSLCSQVLLESLGIDYRQGK